MRRSLTFENGFTARSLACAAALLATACAGRTVVVMPPPPPNLTAGADYEITACCGLDTERCPGIDEWLGESAEWEERWYGQPSRPWWRFW